MVWRVAINGYGRIGRCVLRALYESGAREQLQVVAINELADLATVVHLTKYDSTHGRFPGQVSAVENSGLCINADVIPVMSEADIRLIPWRELGIDLVFECSGTFFRRADAEQHLTNGIGAVLFSQPAESDIDATVVYGINHHLVTAETKIISAASCTTNCIVPVIDCLHKGFGIQQGVITTIHSLMNDQPVIDAYHHTDLRKTRSASHSIIPVETALAKGIDRILPELQGRFEAQALRVPTVNVSAIDLSVIVDRDVTVSDVNALLKEAADNSLEQMMGFTTEPLASCDINHDSRSAIVDASQTRVAGKRLVKVLTWFDNEWAYANRMIDVAKLLLSKQTIY